MAGQKARHRRGVQTKVDPSYFGAHILGPLETNIAGSGTPLLWPPWNPTTLRLWDTYGYNATKAVYEGILWGNIATANGVYDWTLFDAVLAKHISKGVTDLLYTFGKTPALAGGGSGGDQAPTSVTYLSDFATAVANRAILKGLPIRNWELWNEPNDGANVWIGTNAQMVAMAAAVYPAIKAVDPSYLVLTPCPQGNGTTWMDAYLAAGGGAYADVLAFHGYTSLVPETLFSLVSSYKTVFANYGQSGKPIWNTESMDNTTTDVTLQARFLAIYYLIHKSLGLSRFYWYAYDGSDGQEWFYNTGADAVSTADAQVRTWMARAVPGPVTVNGTVYTVPLTKGAQTLAVWDSSGSSSYSAGSYTQQTTIGGVTTAVSGGTVTINKDPLLLS